MDRHRILADVAELQQLLEDFDQGRVTEPDVALCVLCGEGANPPPKLEPMQDWINRAAELLPDILAVAKAAAKSAPSHPSSPRPSLA